MFLPVLISDCQMVLADPRKSLENMNILIFICKLFP